jgi:hypothetical protein
MDPKITVFIICKQCGEVLQVGLYVHQLQVQYIIYKNNKFSNKINNAVVVSQ